MSQAPPPNPQGLKDEGYFRQISFIGVDKDVGGNLLVHVNKQLRVEVPVSKVWKANNHVVYVGTTDPLLLNVDDPVTVTAPPGVTVTLLMLEHRAWKKQVTPTKEQPTQQVQ